MANEHFDDLEIRVFARQEEGYPVEITLGGQQEFPRGYLAKDIADWTSTGDAAKDGQQLFAMLFADSILHNAWVETRGQAPQRRIRLRIDPAAAELHTLPWELLYDSDVLLSANAATPFSRYLPIALPWGGAVEERPIRVLVAISNPGDLTAKYKLAQLDIELERETLEVILKDLDSNTIAMDFLDPPVTLARIEAALREGYHVLHYLGHGAFNQRRKQAALYLEDDAGKTQIVTDDALIGMLARQQVRPRLVFLAACQSAGMSEHGRDTTDAFRGLGPKLVAAGVPAVVAMQDFVALATARQLSMVFYQRITEHGIADLALNEARSTLLTANRPDVAVPVLFMRLKSGQIWGSEADARGQILGSQRPQIFWSGIMGNVQKGLVTPIIGPRVHREWLPTPQEIAGWWAEDHGYPFPDRDSLPRVARYMASSQGEDFPRQELAYILMDELIARLPEELRPTEEFATLTELIEAVGWQTLVADNPNEPHKVLAGLNLPLYLTSNPDSFMTEALAAAGKTLDREICRWNERLDGLPSLFEDDPDYEPAPDSPLVYHLFGSDEELDSLVVTEDHYLDYLVRISAQMERLPNRIWSALTNSSLLFIGYSLDDWEFRVILRGLVATRDRRRKLKHVGVQLEMANASEEETETAQTFLQQYFQEADINIYWGTPEQFIAELREQMESAPAPRAARVESRSRSRSARR
ncbi:MAG: CHAT domain-containing protein [Anaerolineae bacterium]|nr:CHAT domain-containing protein [Anaerolineae bacterium]